VIAGQMPDGCWTYQNPPITPQSEDALLAKLSSNSYQPQGTGKQYTSHSMTQFALLALWGSAKHDISIRPALLLTATHFQNTQHADGTWIYLAKPGSMASRRDSNTCAGLIALAMQNTLGADRTLFRGQLNDEPVVNPVADAQRKKAFVHLANIIGRDAKGTPVKSKTGVGTIIHADAWGDYYFLWCLERVAVIYDLKTIGGKDWYEWGSRLIVEHQQMDGSWRDLHGDVNDTCFALLFLTRANLARDLTERIRTRGGIKID
jgi:hypothetical protein